MDPHHELEMLLKKIAKAEYAILLDRLSSDIQGSIDKKEIEKLVSILKETIKK